MNRSDRTSRLAQPLLAGAGRRGIMFLSRARRLLLPMALVIGWSMLLLFGMYAWPLALTHDVGSRFETMTGLYPPEHNKEFSYAYTRGDATLRFPQTGDGLFVARIRMGGPGAAAPLPARLVASGQPIDLGRVRGIRNYQLLVPSDGRGAVELRLLSSRAVLPGEYRALGVLLDRVELRSTARALPGGVLTLSALGLLLLAGGVLGQRGGAYWRKVAVLLAIGTALGLALGLGRGRVELETWWSALLAGVLGGAFLALGQLDARRLARPVYAVAALFVVWLVAMWFLAGLGAQYHEMLQPLEEIVEQENSTYENYSSLARSVLVGSWVHWDSTHYLSIASTGYEFYGKQWPNVAFFPLYPLLIRAAAPLTGGDMALAGVLVAQVAFFAAMLLLYDLLAHDFGDTPAYRGLVLLLALPTSFFFAAAYSEALALLLLVAAIWALRRKRWWLAGAAGFLLALTRLPGVLIAPILAAAYMHDRGWNWRAVRGPIAAALLPPLGLALFMLFQWWRFDTPFAFLIAQQRWKNHLSPPWVLPQTLLDQIFVYENWPMALFQSLFWAGFLVLTIAALVRLPPLYSLTLLVFLLPPYLSSWPWSISRHVLMGFPAFIILARWAERPLVRQALLLGMLVLLALATVLFVNGFLVA
jgi:hypothetical protein